MKLLVIGQARVRELLPMGECMDVMARSLETLARGDAIQPLRSAMHLPEGRGLLGMMPAWLGGIDVHGIKTVSVFPGNHGTAYDAHQGAVLLFEGVHGCPVAVMDGSEITGIRTAAVSGLATRLLARADARSLAILGSGVQARHHLDAMCAVREIDRVRVWSRSPDRARAFASWARDQGAPTGGPPVEAADTAQQAVKGADIICTTTSAAEPVLQGDWIATGAHVNAVGSCLRSRRELDTEAVVRFRLYVDRIESTLNESGDLLIPMAEGAVTEAHIQGEIGDLLTGSAEGRRSPDEITLFKSLGLGVEDLAAAWHIHRKAVERGLGTWVEFGSAPDEAENEAD